MDDLALKQMALERVVRASDVNESRCEMAVWRLQDKSNEAKKLAADNQQLRWGGVTGAWGGRGVRVSQGEMEGRASANVCAASTIALISVIRISGASPGLENCAKTLVPSPSS